MASLKYLLVSLRPRQWTKNLLVFLALLFSVRSQWDPTNLALALNLLTQVVLAFILFSLLTGSVYIINDLLDLEADRRHPVKRHRPLASGRLSPTLALVVSTILAAVSLGLSFWLQPAFGLVAITYLAAILAYSLVLKSIVILDILTIAAGFVLRAVAGAVVIEVPVSPWLYVCTLLGALFIALAKRRQELVVVNGANSGSRHILKEYSPRLLDEMIAVVTPATLIAYSLYTFSAENLPKNGAMMLTIPFVIYGIFRYLYLVHRKNLGESPEEILLTDKPLLIDILLWLATAGGVLFLFPAA